MGLPVAWVQCRKKCLGDKCGPCYPCTSRPNLQASLLSRPSYRHRVWTTCFATRKLLLPCCESGVDKLHYNVWKNKNFAQTNFFCVHFPVHSSICNVYEPDLCTLGPILQGVPEKMQQMRFLISHCECMKDDWWHHVRIDTRLAVHWCEREWIKGCSP
jgi:hypothetical protein